MLSTNNPLRIPLIEQSGWDLWMGAHFGYSFLVVDPAFAIAVEPVFPLICLVSPDIIPEKAVGA